jgi:hypothetical protein
MENKSKTGISRNNAVLIVIGTIASCFILLTILFHLRISELEKDFENFATHHYFIVGFVSLVILLYCIKLYNNTPEKITSFNIFRKQIRNKRIIKEIEVIEKYKDELISKINNSESVLIEKEKAGLLTFPRFDVLQSFDEITQREKDLNSALTLGNLHKQKIKIFFQDIISKKHIETTIWQVNSTHISLKGGVVVPVRSIYKIEF